MTPGAVARMIRRHRCRDLRNRWGNTRPTAEDPQPGQNNNGDGKTDTKKQHYTQQYSSGPALASVVIRPAPAELKADQHVLVSNIDPPASQGRIGAHNRRQNLGTGDDGVGVG